ncbi:heavy-metal-associated domain-containing protein [Oceanimonas doudoroffii]|uniref:Heavy metal transporter n=1 Tax=Oceanimonas doudoroffii TaxID=84158 RepID=A0A233RJ10_9GAMM|nr:heavy-metal-associated domain-containing protein [Oceanimonas doudoroffii]OXY83382.1 heavy metal transporter [Oceanimonas doudoroffii]
MHILTVPDMTCGHCVGVISAVLTELDPDCELSFELASRRVEIGTRLPREEIVEALSDAGYDCE